MLKAEDINRFVTQQSGSIRVYIFFTSGLVLLGLALLLFGTGKAEATIKLTMQIGGGFIASLSGFPIKEVVAKKEKIQAIKTLQDLLSRHDVSKMADSEVQKYNDLAFEILKKSALQ